MMSVPGREVEALGRLETRVATLLAQVPGVVFAFDNEGVITFSAGRGLRAVGRRSGEAIGQSVFDLYSDAPWVLRAARRALAGETVRETGEVRGRWFELHQLPVRQPDGTLDGVVGVAIDVTDRWRATEDLRRTQERYRALIDSIDGVVWEVDVASFCFTFVSKQAERLLGYPIEQWLQPGFWLNHLHPDDRQWAPEFCQTAIAERRAHQFSYRMIAADGREVWLRDVVTVVSENDRLMLRGVMVDITPLKRAAAERDEMLVRAQAARAEAEQAEGQSRSLADRMRTLAEASLAFAEASVDFAAIVELVVRQVGTLLGDGCLLRVISEDGQLLEPVSFFHPVADRMETLRQTLGGSTQRVDEGVTAAVCRMGEPLLLPIVTPELVHREMKREYWPYLESVGSVLVAPLRTRGRVIGILTVLRDRPGRPYNRNDESFLQDLAVRAAQALEVSRLFQQAQEAIRARDEFLSVASHELRTPLTASLLQLQILERAQGSPERLAALLPGGLAALGKQLSRLTQLTDDLLDVSKLRLGQLELHVEAVELLTLVREVVARLEWAIAGSRSTVSIRGDRSVVGEWDRMRLDQVVTGLLSNALKFGEGRPIELVVTSAGERAQLIVRDQGVGIPLPMQTRIFDRFERAVSLREFGGLGLGLYVVRRIVEAHGGAIRVESAPGQGATFIVELPLRASAAAG